MPACLPINVLMFEISRKACSSRNECGLECVRACVRLPSRDIDAHQSILSQSQAIHIVHVRHGVMHYTVLFTK